MKNKCQVYGIPGFLIQYSQHRGSDYLYIYSALSLLKRPGRICTGRKRAQFQWNGRYEDAGVELSSGQMAQLSSESSAAA